MIHFIVISSVLMLALGSNAAALPVSTAHCEAATKELRNKIGELNYSQFDQTDGQGWRKLWDAQCYQSGATLIDGYIAARRDLRIKSGETSFSIKDRTWLFQETSTPPWSRLSNATDPKKRAMVFDGTPICVEQLRT
jgi:hypothetical protein